MRLLTGYQKPVPHLAISADGRTLYTAGEKQQTVRVWDLERGEVVQQLQRHRSNVILGLMCPTAGHRLFALRDNGSVSCWDLSSEEHHELTLKKQGEDLCMAVLGVSPDATRLVVPLRTWSREVDSATPIYLQIFNSTSGERLARLTVSRPITALGWSHDGQWLAAGTEDRQVILWDIAQGKAIRRFSVTASPEQVTFSPDGKLLAYAAGATVSLWRVVDGETLPSLVLRDRLKSLAFSPDGRYLSASGRDGIVRLWKVPSLELAGEKHLEIGRVHGLVWLPDSSTLVAGGDRLLAVCPVDEVVGTRTSHGPASRGEPLTLRGHKKHIGGMRFSPDGQRLCSWENDRLLFWDMSRGAGGAKATGGFPSPVYRCSYSQVSWSPDGARLALDGWDADLCDASTGSRIVVPRADSPPTQFLAYTPTGRLLLTQRRSLTNAHEHHLFLLDENFRCVKKIDWISTNSYIKRVSFSGVDDARLYLGFTYGEVCRWTPGENRIEALFTLPTQVVDLAVTSNERTLVSAGGNTAIVWNFPEGKPRHRLKHGLSVNAIALTPDGRRVLTACNDGIVRLWSLESGKELLALDLEMGRVETVAIAPDGMYFAAGVVKKRAIVLMDLPED